MILQEHIEALANKTLEGTDIFITDVKVSTGNVITVTIDSETSLTIDDCIKVSRSIESSLDRDEEDFELRVTSYGADQPIRFQKQYKKNIGRQLEIILSDDTKITGTLTDVNESTIELEIKESKKKNAASVKTLLAIKEIKEAKVILSFR
jgi:ribosome maturation factor RimP